MRCDRIISLLLALKQLYICIWGQSVRFAICNELFGDMDLDRAFATMRETGFHGVELAPHTVFGDFSGGSYTAMDKGIARVRRALDNEGLSFAGLHWLLVGPSDLHVTSPDDSVWRRSWDHVARLADLAGEFGGGAMVFGSPAQRASGGLLPPSDARRRFVDGLLTVADRVHDANSRILLEALAAAHTDIMNTLEQVCAVIADVDHPAVQTVFDFHNVEDEQLSWPDLIRKYAGSYTHVHLNELDGGPPTLASDMLHEYRAAFAALTDTGYDGWVSLEIFTVPDDPADVLRSVREFLTEMVS